MGISIRQQQQAPDGNHLDELPWYAHKESDSSLHNSLSLSLSLSQQTNKQTHK
jgi:hypothetical protein